MSFTERYRFLGLSPPSRRRLAASDIAGFPDAVYQYEFDPIIQLDAPSQPLAGVGILYHGPSAPPLLTTLWGYRGKKGLIVIDSDSYSESGDLLG